MNIEKIIKRKNKFEVILSDNTSLSFYDEVIVKFNLLKPRKVTEYELLNMQEYNTYISCYKDAIKYINQKLRTKKEIENKLSNYEKSIIAKVINVLEEKKIINDELYVNSYTSDQVRLTPNGPIRIKNNLLNMGFNETLIEESLSKYDELVWEEKIKKLINKKINSNHNKSNKALISSLKVYLSNLGFNNELINKYLNNIKIEESNDIINKEYLKIMRKLSRKYSGEELRTKVKYSLYKKGFSMAQIEEIISLD